MRYLCLRRDTYEHEFDDEFPGICNRLAVCEKESPFSSYSSLSWREVGDPSNRAEDVFIELKRRE